MDKNDEKNIQKGKDDFGEIDENFVLDVIDEAMEGCSEEDKVGVLLTKTGMFWPADYRYSTMPENFSRSDFDGYLSWLADFLYNLDAKPSEEQKGLCVHLERMTPEGGAFFLGYNFGTFFSVSFFVEVEVEEGQTLEEFLSSKNMIDYFNSIEDDEERESEIEFTKELFTTAEYNYKNKLKYSPDYDLLDLPVRVPLSILLKKEPDKEKRVKLLKIYYDTAGDMLSK